MVVLKVLKLLCKSERKTTNVKCCERKIIKRESRFKNSFWLFFYVDKFELSKLTNFSMLNRADSLYLIGLNMDPSKIHSQLKNLRVESIDSFFHRSCTQHQKHCAPTDERTGVDELYLRTLNVFLCHNDEGW